MVIFLKYLISAILNLIKIKLNVSCFLISNILVGREIDYTCLYGSWNGKVWEPLP